MARVLVIGGNLFIGRVLVERLLERNEVVIMHRSKGTPFGDRVIEISCDRNDAKAVRAALSNQKFDIVYDNVYDWQRGTTAEQVIAAVEPLAPHLKRYVFTSSVAVYPPGGPYDENASLLAADHPNLYGAQKAETERALFDLYRREGVPVATIRPSFIYGPGNPFPRETWFWERILAGRPVIIPEDGAATMQWVHVDDVAEAAIRAATIDGAIGHAYNLGNYPPITQRAFIELLAQVAGEPVELVPVPRARIEEAGGQLAMPPMYFGAYLDLPPITARTERVREELGLELRSLEDGLRETYAWYRSQPKQAVDFTWENGLLAL
jgi:nucleoside-diphosphate-sugar epimerase